MGDQDPVGDTPMGHQDPVGDTPVDDQHPVGDTPVGEHHQLADRDPEADQNTKCCDVCEIKLHKKYIPDHMRRVHSSDPL